MSIISALFDIPKYAQASSNHPAAQTPQGDQLRPSTFDAYVNQVHVKDALRMAITSARMRHSQLDHVLLSGPPGLGKTTLAGAIAHEMGTSMVSINAPSIEKPLQLAEACYQVVSGGVLFIDEIHRLPMALAELLYPLMEGRAGLLMQGNFGKRYQITLPAFTLIGATTMYGTLAAPLRDRFGHIHRLEYYSVTSLTEVVKRSARILGAPIEPGAAVEITERSRGTPRIANRLLARCFDQATVDGEQTISFQVSRKVLASLGIDSMGLDKLDRDILNALCVTFAGKPVGLETLAFAVSEDKSTVTQVSEPFLQNIGFLTRTPKGRQATPAAFAHLEKT